VTVNVCPPDVPPAVTTVTVRAVVAALALITKVALITVPPAFGVALLTLTFVPLT
jgi:hypothetical protein